MVYHRFLFSLTFLVSTHTYAGEKYKDTRSYIDSPHDAQPIFEYIKDNDLTLANADFNLQKKFGSDYVKKYSLYVVKFDFRSILLKIIEMYPDQRTMVLKEMGMERKEVQDTFLKKPLYEALMWYACCDWDRWNLGCDFNTRLLLTCDQYFCLSSILHASTKKPKSDRYYVDEETHKQIPDKCVFITQKAKNMLLSLPQEFVTDSKAAAMLKDITVAEKPSRMSQMINTPLALFFYSLRAPIPPENSSDYEQWKIILTSRIGYSMFSMIPSIFFTKEIYWTSVLGSIATVPCFQFCFKTNNTYYDDKNKPQCIVPTTIRSFGKPALLSCIFPGFIKALNTLTYWEQPTYPLSAIIPRALGIVALFAFWDLNYKFELPKYAVKTQSMLDMIKSSKKQGREPFCALF